MRPPPDADRSGTTGASDLERTEPAVPVGGAPARPAPRRGGRRRRRHPPGPDDADPQRRPVRLSCPPPPPPLRPVFNNNRCNDNTRAFHSIRTFRLPDPHQIGLNQNQVPDRLPISRRPIW